MEPTTDEDLLFAVQQGRTDHLGTLVARYEKPLFRFAYRLLNRPEEARDVCQETFLRVLQKSHRFRPGSRFSTWMYQIALNLCRDRLRRRKRWRLRILEKRAGSPNPGDDAPTALGDDADPSGRLEREEKTRAVALALQRLPAGQREVLVLKEYEELTFRQIAQVLGCPESTVKSRLYAGLGNLRSILVEQGIGGL